MVSEVKTRFSVRLTTSMVVLQEHTAHYRPRKEPQRLDGCQTINGKAGNVLVVAIGWTLRIAKHFASSPDSRVNY